MTQTLVHRGPDDSGIWCDESSGIALGQRRLSIIDLSQQGHQPMLSHDGRYVMVLNGEIYNHQQLRIELENCGYQFRGASDTEVAICAIQQWGLASALTRYVGMFSLAVWDRQNRSMMLARDRIGEKPLYYGRFNNTFGFASELKALTVHPHWRGEVDRSAIALQMKYTYISGPTSIYKGIYKLLPGSYIELSPENGYRPGNPVRYWSLKEVVLSGTASRNRKVDPAIVVDQLHELLVTTIRDKMMADVPLGAFLSGGIDSSLIVALMQVNSSRPVKTFTIGFNETGYDEAVHAQAIAAHLGTEHTELYVSPADTLSVIPDIPDYFDEPFSDSSQIPTFLLSRLARTDVTVALSGDGGDELFGGYSRYLVGLDAWNIIRKIPLSLRRAGGKLIRGIPAAYIDLLARPVRPFLPGSLRYNQFGHKLHKLAGVWDSDSPDAVYNSLICLWTHPEEIVIGASEMDMLESHRTALEGITNFTERMMYADTVTYLPDDILVKVDRASMAASLEVRVPFLDHRIIEFIWNQSADLKIVGNEGKWLLRQILSRYVPLELTDRPKMGFGVPLDKWLRGPLKEWAGDLLAEDRLNRQGIFRSGPVQKKWQQHLSGEIAWHYQLWPILMYQAWHDRWIRG